MILAGAALLICSVLGLLAGILSAVRQFGWTDRIITFAVLLGISTPSFWLGLLLILLFAVTWRVLPVSGMYAIYGGGDLPDLLRHLVLPGRLAGTRAVLAFLAREISPDTYLNLMAQYHPCYRADEYPTLDRPLRMDEYQQALTLAEHYGLKRLD